jgi:predicted permease
MPDRDKERSLSHRLIALIGWIVPRRLRARWRQEWEAELQYRERLLARWNRLDWPNRFELLRRSLGALRDALYLQPRRLEEEMFQDLRYGLRILRQRPGFTLVAVMALALGIGANTAIFSVVNAVLLRPLPYDEPERLVWLWENNPPRADRMGISLLTFRDWKEQSRSFAHIGASRVVNFTLTGTDQPERLLGAQVNAEVFQAIGVKPLAGRTFLPEEDRPGGSRVAVLSHGLWQRKYGSDPELVGKTLTLGGAGYTVIGIMPPEYSLIAGGTELWVPLGQFVNQLPQERGNHVLPVVLARLNRGVTLEGASVEMNNIARRLGELYPENKGSGVTIIPVQEQMVSNIRPLLLVLAGAVGFVLLIACANVANLLLARAATREKEIAIRIALGAGRIRILRQLLTESVLLSLLGGAAGLLLAAWGTRLLIASLPLNVSLPRQSEIGLDAHVLAFTIIVSLLSALLFGLMPAFRAARTNLNASLKEGGRQTGGGSSRAGRMLVIAEVALTLVLLIGAGLMLNSFARLSAVDPGFITERVLTMRFTLSILRYPERQQWTSFYERLLERVAQLPGVESAGLTSAVPLTIGGGGDATVIAEGQPFPKSAAETTQAFFQTISPDYHHTMGIRLLNGRYFNSLDTENSAPVVVIDETLARRFWPNEDPIGKRLSFENRGTFEDLRPTWREVVGVVRHVVRNNLDGQGLDFVQLYVPLRQLAFWHQESRPPMGLVVRSTVEPTALTAAIRGQVQAIDKDIPIYNVNPMEQVVADSLAQRRISTWLLGTFASVALLLAAIGIYGVIATSVSQRRHEIGIRMALGATRRDVLRLVMGQGLRLVVIGVVLGLAGGAAFSQALSGMLFGHSPFDLVTYVGVSVFLIVIASVAIFLPARRAANTNPMVALRPE